MTWAELLRKLKDAGFVEHRTGKGSHVAYIQPRTSKVVWLGMHTKKEVSKGLARKILKDAGIE